jgi:hypothetical protein
MPMVMEVTFKWCKMENKRKYKIVQVHWILETAKVDSLGNIIEEAADIVSIEETIRDKQEEGYFLK